MTSSQSAFMSNFVYWLRQAERPDIDSYLLEIAGLGIRQVFVPGSGLRELEPEARVPLSHVKQAQRDTDMHVHTVHGLFDGCRNLGEADKARRQAAICLHAKTLEIAAELGADNVVLHLEKTCSDAIEAAARHSLDQLLPTAENMRVKIALETLPPRYYGGEIEHLRELLDDYPNEWLGVCLDTGHAALGEGPKQWIDGLADRIITLHLHDNDGTADQHLPPGLGVIDWDETLTALFATAYERPIVSEARMPERWDPSRMIEQFQSVCWPYATRAAEARPGGTSRC